VVLCLFTFQCALLCYYQIPVFVRLVMSSPNGITLNPFVFLPLLVLLYYNIHVMLVVSGERLFEHKGQINIKIFAAYILNKTHIFTGFFINDNNLSSVVPILGRYNLIYDIFVDCNWIDTRWQ
jgi:hypothetical protein